MNNERGKALKTSLQLEEVRKEIDIIDDELVRLLVRRFDRAVQAARLKSEMGKNLFDGNREEAIIEAIRQMAQTEGVCEESDLKSLESIFRELLHESKEWQARHL